jgi:vacuolar-type H+-ATPase subunit H
MEELQSTEILEREILEDARKKALRILKTAEDAARAQKAEWDKKTDESIGELVKKYDKQKELAGERVMARLPIDKLRIRVGKIENLLQSAVETWYQGLSRRQIIELLRKELLKRVALCEELSSSSQKAACAYYSGLDRNEAEEALNIKGGNNFVMEEVSSSGRYPSITLETERTRIIASIQEMVDALLHEKRAELIEALIGRGLLEDA